MALSNSIGVRIRGVTRNLRDWHLDQEFALLTFEHDGHSFEILNMDDAARAVAEGRIVPDTRLTVYANDGGIGVKSATDVPVISALFTTAKTVEPAPIPPPEPEPSTLDEAPPAGEDYLLRLSVSDGRDGPAYLVRWSIEVDVPFEAGDILCIVQTEHAIIRLPAPGTGRMAKKLVRTHAPVGVGTPLAMLRLEWRPDKELAPDIRYFTPSAVPPPPPASVDAFYAEPPARRGGMGCGLWLVIIIGILVLAVLAKNGMEQPSEDRARNAAVSVDNVDIGAPDFRPPGDIVSRYIVRRAATYNRPEDSAQSDVQLERGGSVNGIYIRNTDGEDWFWLADGAAKGQYLRASDLSQRTPPTLVQQTERTMPLVADAAVFVWPDTAASAQVDDNGTAIVLSAGATVTVIGATASDFYEITLSDAQGGGVGYIARAAIDGGAVAAPADGLLDRGIASAASALKQGAQMALSSPSPPALKVSNRCPMTATIIFYYRAAEGWTHHKGASWDYEPGASGYPTLPIGDRLFPVNGELFYAAAPKGQGPLRQGRYDKALIINGQEFHFRRAQLDRLSNGDYTFELTC